MKETTENLTVFDEDHYLVTRFLTSRDEEDFRLLYRRHAPRLNKLIARLMGMSNGDVKDVIQITWTRIVENLDKFRFESSLHTWLTGIAINCSREQLRNIMKTSVAARIEHLEGDHCMITTPIRRIDLERAITSLPEGYREILILHDVEGYTHEEISRFLNIEAGTSKSQLSRARHAMRHKLTDRKGQNNEDRSRSRP